MSEIKITVQGPAGSGKSALLGEIEILCKALGVPVRYADPSDAASEKSMTHADWTAYLEMYKPSVVLHEKGPDRAALASAPVAGEAQRPTLAVWYGSMPESNGKTNWTAILYRKDEGLGGGVNITLDRSEYPDRVRYEADRARYLIGEIDQEPWILDYDADKCDAAPQASDTVRDQALEDAAQAAYTALFPTNDRSDWTEFAESAAYSAKWAAQCIRALKSQSSALSAQPSGNPGELAAQPGAQKQEIRYGTNYGHGHVWRRPDGMVTRCGGPGICIMCTDDQAHADRVLAQNQGGSDA